MCETIADLTVKSAALTLPKVQLTAVKFGDIIWLLRINPL